ncbi:MAG TPA: prolyl oligopeptidase family serine peptidase [Lacipirellulaceae bacterium]|nr:prolyl oligopeptidase family serine peptidase [Lacipirellulaceae bacterium]
MSIALAAALLGAILMAQADGALNIEPGKQLPQSVIVHVGSGTEARDVTIRYYLFVPQNYKPTGDKWPLLLFLHGAGESSNDDLSRAKIHGPAKMVESRPDFPFVLITPQCPPTPGYDPLHPPKEISPQLLDALGHAWKPEELIKLVDHVAGKLNIDADHLYVTGLSMGGYGTWRLVAAYPDRFAAAVPICGGGDADELAKPLSKVPIWAFHGAKDTTVPPKASRDIVDAVRREHGDIEYTVYPDAGHDAWTATYNNPKVYDWLLSHRRKSN